MRRDHLSPSLGDSEMSSSRAFQEAGLGKVGLGSMNSVSEQRLFSGGQELGSVVRSKV